jgi:hypothetical protein
MGKTGKAKVEKTMSGPKRAAIYVRVSTVEQETDLQEHELQARRKLHADEIGRMRVLRSEGMSIRKLAIDFDTTQWMAARLTRPEPVGDATVLVQRCGGLWGRLSSSMP